MNTSVKFNTYVRYRYFLLVVTAFITPPMVCQCTPFKTTLLRNVDRVEFYIEISSSVSSSPPSLLLKFSFSGRGIGEHACIRGNERSLPNVVLQPVIYGNSRSGSVTLGRTRRSSVLVMREDDESLEFGVSARVTFREFLNKIKNSDLKYLPVYLGLDFFVGHPSSTLWTSFSYAWNSDVFCFWRPSHE